MAHTTHSYYRDRLGFEPDAEPHRRHATSQRKDQLTKTSASATNDSNDSNSHSHSSRIRVLEQQQHTVVTSSTSTSSRTKTVSNGGAGPIMPTGVYEENLNKFKGRKREQLSLPRNRCLVLPIKGREEKEKGGKKERKEKKSGFCPKLDLLMLLRVMRRVLGCLHSDKDCQNRQRNVFRLERSANINFLFQ